MRLFYVPGACSITPQIVLRETGLPFMLDRIDLKAGKKTQAGESYLALNPKGYVPALQLDDGQILTEAAVIMQYLADLKPEAKLAPPAGTLARVRLNEWMHFLAMELHKGASPLYQPYASEDFKAGWRANRFEPRWQVLAKHMEGREFLFGDGFTIADVYAFYLLRTYQGPILKGDLAKLKPLDAYFARLSERPSIKASLAAESAPT